MQENFKTQKIKENSRNFISVKNRTEKNTKNLSPAKSWAKLSQRSTCFTPAKEKMNTSFRSARSRSRSKSRVKDSPAEVEWVGVNHDQIADPSIIARAQDILGIFNVKKKEETSEPPKPEPTPDHIPENQNEKSKISEVPKSKSQGLLFNRREIPSKGVNLIDEGLKKVHQLLKERSQNDDLIVDVNMPDGTMKTLQIPKGSNQRLVVQKFIKENKLSQEMGKTLLNSINNS
jgi:hypothetical protein